MLSVVAIMFAIVWVIIGIVLYIAGRQNNTPTALWEILFLIILSPLFILGFLLWSLFDDTYHYD